MLQISFITFACCLVAFVSCNIEVSRATKGSFTDRFQIQGALEIRSTRSLLGCQAACVSNKQCIFFFYNQKEKKCILHEDSFTYTQPTETGAGWNFYLTTDANESTERICIQGTDSKVPGVWTFDDGTVMNYTNWDSGEPDYNQGYLEMYTGYRWHDLGATSTNPCLPICEKRF